MGTQGIDPDDLLELQQLLAPRMTKREGPFPKGLTFNDMVAQASWKVRLPMLRPLSAAAYQFCARSEFLKDLGHTCGSGHDERLRQLEACLRLSSGSNCLWVPCLGMAGHVLMLDLLLHSGTAHTGVRWYLQSVLSCSRSATRAANFVLSKLACILQGACTWKKHLGAEHPGQWDISYSVTIFIIFAVSRWAAIHSTKLLISVYKVQNRYAIDFIVGCCC